MATKPTIHRCQLQLVDMNRELYTSCKLTLARHPSETAERMMVRLLVYGLNYSDCLHFCKGLSATDEADLWALSAQGNIEHWIEVGQATPERLRKAISRAQQVSLYAYGRETDIWWDRQVQALNALPKLSVWRLQGQSDTKLEELVARNMALTLTITDSDLFLNSEELHCELSCTRLL